MPLVFISHIDGYVGSAIKNAFASVKDGEYRFIGTGKSGGKGVELVDSNNNEALKSAVLRSDIIIYDIFQDLPGGDIVLQALASGTFEEEKVFICLSSVLTWGKTVSKVAPDEPVSDEEYKVRKPHVNYREQLTLEKSVFKLLLKKETVRPFIVAAGLAYGDGEELLHGLFKRAWHGQPLPLFAGDGANVVPTIHVRDLASVVQQVAATKPDERYLLAVDASNVTLADVVQTLSTSLGSGAVQRMSPQQAQLELAELSQAGFDLLTLNLRTSPAAVNNLSGVEWVAQAGLVETIGPVLQQFRTKRGLTPLRIVVLGPPAAGKTSVARALAAEYAVPHIDAKLVLDEALAPIPTPTAAAPASADDDTGAEGDDAAAAAAAADGGGAAEEGGAAAAPVVDEAAAAAAAALQQQQQQQELREAMEANGGRLPDEQLLELLKKKLRSWPCQNQGWLLDGLPKSLAQAEALFDADAAGEEAKGVPLPDFAVILDTNDDTLRQRLLSAPQSELVDGHSDEAGFTRRLTAYRAANTAEAAVANFFEEHDGCLPLYLPADAPVAATVAAVRKHVGKPHNYGPSAEEIATKQRQEAEAEAARAAKAAAEQREQAAREAAEQQRKQREWQVRLDKLQREEQHVLQLQSTPFRKYLMENVMPTLTAGLIELCKVRPADPVDYLAEYLFAHDGDAK